MLKISLTVKQHNFAHGLKTMALSCAKKVEQFWVPLLVLYYLHGTGNSQKNALLLEQKLEELWADAPMKKYEYEL